MSRCLYLFIKRVFDIVVSFFGVIVFIVAAFIIKIAYVLDGDHHPILFKQTRVGKDGREFQILKFRSMVWNADDVLKELLKKPKYKKQWNSFQKLDNDPRITKIGKIIRTGSIDEIPQFLNVFCGSMTMVGPRPLLPGELKAHGGSEKKYNSVKPGMTGYWATRGRSDSDYEERLKMEYYYVDNQSLKLDIKILFRTVEVVFHRKGAK